MYHNLGLERGITLSSLVHCPGMVEEAAVMLEGLGVDWTDMRQLQQVWGVVLNTHIVASYIVVPLEADHPLWK